MGNKNSGDYNQSMVTGPDSSDTLNKPVLGKGGLPMGYGGEGGVRGAVSVETLPNVSPMGVNLDGTQGTDGMGGHGMRGAGVMSGANRQSPSDSIDHGMDSGHAKASTEMGRMAHGIGDVRGGHYFCAAEGCDYNTRDKTKFGKHVGAKKRYGMGTSSSSASSMSAGSSSAAGSAGSTNSYSDHGVGRAAFLRDKPSGHKES